MKDKETTLSENQEIRRKILSCLDYTWDVVVDFVSSSHTQTSVALMLIIWLL